MLMPIYSPTLGVKTLSVDATTSQLLEDAAHRPVRLSDTEGILLYSKTGASDDLNARHFSINTSSGALTIGAELDISTSPDNSNLPIGCRLSSTDILVCWREVSDSDVKAAVIQNSGGTLSKGTTATVSAETVPGAVSVCALSSTKALAFYQDPTTGNLWARVLNVSGTTITVGAEQTIGSGHTSSRYPSVVAISSTEAIVSFSNGNNLSFYALDISGDTVTNGTIANVAFSDSVGYPITGDALSGSRAVFAAARNATANSFAVCVTKSGTGIQAGSLFTLATDADSNQRGSPCISSYGTNFAIAVTQCQVSGSDRVLAQSLTLSGNNIKSGAQLNIGASFGAGPGGGALAVCTLSITQAIAVSSATDNIKSLRIA